MDAPRFYRPWRGGDWPKWLIWRLVNLCFPLRAKTKPDSIRLSKPKGEIVTCMTRYTIRLYNHDEIIEEGEGAGLTPRHALLTATVHNLLAGKGWDGAFGTWVEARCGFSRRTAENAIQAYATFGGKKCETVSHLFSARSLYLLSAESCPEKATAEALRLAQKIASRIGRTAASVARKRRELGIVAAKYRK